MVHLKSWDETFMNIAVELSEQSKATRNKVGAILVKDKRIISIGINGTPSGFSNVCEENGVTKKEVLHAESNCIAKCSISTESSFGSTLYTTLSPCYECSKIIIQSGIKSVYYKKKYRDLDGIKLLKKAKIDVYELL